jgi:hypothetical protein
VGSNLTKSHEDLYFGDLKKELIKLEAKLEILSDFKKKKDKKNEVDETLNEEIAELESLIQKFKDAIEGARKELREHMNECQEELIQHMM